jgi:outer membrane receptor protein involved in Fe transport
LDGRYVGRYRDYDSSNEIGNFWLIDASFHWAIGSEFASESKSLKGTYVQFGGVNIFNRLPQFSNFEGGVVGYDPSQGDVRGRFLYVQFGARL